MKKTIFLSVLLVVCAACIFYFGWTQYRLAPDSYGVIHSRTGGYHDTPIVSGKFSWTPASLIPKNVTIYQIPATPRSIHSSYDGQLPSGTLYGMPLMGTPDFSVFFELDVTYRIRIDSVVSLVKDQGLRSEGIEVWFASKEKDITERLAATLIHSASKPSPDVSSHTYERFIQTITDQFLATWNSSTSPLEIISLDIYSLEIPDFELYEAGKSAYQELTSVKTASLEQELLGNAAVRAEYETRPDYDCYR